LHDPFMKWGVHDGVSVVTSVSLGKGGGGLKWSQLVGFDPSNGLSVWGGEDLCRLEKMSGICLRLFF